MKISTVSRTPLSIAASMSGRVRQRRIAAGLSREALAAKAGVSRDTVKRFEQTGQATLGSLLRIAFALGTLNEWDTLFAEPIVTALSLDALEDARAIAARTRAPRQRARRADAGGETVSRTVVRERAAAARRGGPQGDESVPPASGSSRGRKQ